MAEQEKKSPASKTEIILKAAEKLKGVPTKFWDKWRMPDTEDDIDEFVNEVRLGFYEFRHGKANNESSQSSDTPSTEEIDNILSRIVD